MAEWGKGKSGFLPFPLRKKRLTSRAGVFIPIFFFQSGGLK